jgi:succinoglycan biosynthesis transport protein ExoP
VPWLGPTGTDALRSILVGLGGRPLASREAEALIDRKIAELQSRLTVARIGETFAIEVRSRSEDADFAARMTNAVVASYLQDLSEANEWAARGASAWLRDAVKEAGPSARVISDATPPVNRDGPRVLHVLAAALIGGGLAGIATAFARDLFDRRLWRPDQIAALVGAECFGALPRLDGYWQKTKFRTDPDGPEEAAAWLGLADLDEAYKWAILHPGSRFAHVIERVHVAATVENRHIKTLGVTAAASREGASLVALNLALSAAMSGRKVLLVDASVSKSGLTTLLAPKAEYTATDVFDGLVDISVAVSRDPLTGLQFLPAGWDRICLRPDLAAAFDRVGQDVDLIVVDLPPLMPRPDVRAMTSRLDAFLLVVEAGNLPRDEIARRLDISGVLRERLLGSVLNKADERRLKA